MNTKAEVRETLAETKEHPGFLAERTGKKGADGNSELHGGKDFKEMMPQTMENLHNQRQSAVT